MVNRVVVLLLLASGAAIAGSWQALVSPAPLSPGHKALEGDCDACHLVFSGVPNGKCLGCHSWIATKQATGGFHADVATQSCQACHVDHQGSKGAHTKKSALQEFDHARTTFALQGRHAATKCVECHRPQQQVGRVARVGPDKSCATCHDDAHAGKLGTSCATCHSADGWKKDLKTLAAHAIPTSGGHQGLTCTDCHAKGRALEKASTCIDCHKSDDQHGGVGVSCESCHTVAGFKPAEHDHDDCTCRFPGKHKTVSCLECHKAYKFTGTPTLCSGCHDQQRTHEPLGECSRCHTALSWKDNRFDHNAPRSEFLIERKHLEVSCSQCHVQKDKKGRTQFRAADPDCRSCHAQLGEATHGDFGDCRRCHDTSGFENTKFDHARDAKVPLTGKHAAINCKACHAEKTKGHPRVGGKTAMLDGRRALGGAFAVRARHGVVVAQASAPPKPGASSTATDAAPAAAPHGVPAGPDQPDVEETLACVHCHADRHAGQVGTDCARCHTTTVWKPTLFGLEAHAATGFALDGRHAQTQCASCHIDGKLVGLPVECAGCHVDRHRGKLGPDCKSCHTTTAFVPAAQFDHARTGFAITKQHAAVSCKDCHGPKREKDLTRVQGALDCKSCHTAGHASFDIECVSCHLPEDAQLGAASGTRGQVDHRDTGFPLERAHSVLPCKSCHAANQPDPPTRCASCHQDPHGGSATYECKDCHRPDRFSLARFDHDRTTFSLRGRHMLTPCTTCHLNQTWVGARTECFDCHASDAARARATVGGHAFGPVECRDCHRSTWRW